jgi:hypothetical protein
MSNLSQILGDLQTQRKQLSQELERLDTAIRALQGVGGRNGTVSIRGSVTRIRRTMSVAARKRIAAAQRVRWAKWKAKQKAA